MTLGPPPSGTCAVCGRALSLLDAQTAPVCRAPACGWKYASTPKDRRCRVCGRLLAFSEMATGLCSTMQCRHTGSAEAMRSRRAHDELEAQKLREQGARTLRIAHAESYPLAHIPSSSAEVIRLPRRRRRVFRKRLRGLIREAFARAPVDQAPAQPLPAKERSGPRARELAVVLERACGQCRGFCCGTGGDHAFITVDTIDRYRRTHPDHGPRTVLAAYANMIGTDTFRDGCVFQNADGCALPRAMRSDTCNQFLCAGLRKLTDRQPENGPVRGFVFSTERGEVVSGAFLDARRARPVGGT